MGELPGCSYCSIFLHAGTDTAALPLPALVPSLIPDENTQTLWVKPGHSAQRCWPETQNGHRSDLDQN